MFCNLPKGNSSFYFISYIVNVDASITESYQFLCYLIFISVKLLDRYYPGVLNSNPSIGRQGKALRRQQLRRSIEFQSGPGGSDLPASNPNSDFIGNVTSMSMISSKVHLTSRRYIDAAAALPKGPKVQISLFRDIVRFL